MPSIETGILLLHEPAAAEQFAAATYRSVPLSVWHPSKAQTQSGFLPRVALAEDAVGASGPTSAPHGSSGSEIPAPSSIATSEAIAEMPSGVAVL